MAFQAGLYWIIDPLCGWSYGALPLINRTAEHFTERQHILPGGLFIDAQRRRLDADWLAHVHEHDDRIAKLTGMPFGRAYKEELLARDGLLLDSLPVTRGLLALQQSGEPADALRFLNAIQTAWYRDGRDITRDEVVNAVIQHATGLPVVNGQVAESEARAAIQYGRMVLPQAAGAGFPCAVLVQEDGRYTRLPVSQYYGNPDAFMSLVKTYR